MNEIIEQAAIAATAAVQTFSPLMIREWTVCIIYIYFKRQSHEDRQYSYQLGHT